MDKIIDLGLKILGRIRGQLEIPLDIFLNATEFSAGRGWFLLYDIVALAVIFVFLKWLVKKVWRFFKPERLVDGRDVAALKSKEDGFTDSLDAASNFDATAGPLKKQKEWGRLAEVYASVDKPKDAAKWFKKDKNYRRAGEEYAKAGLTLKAAKIMMKAGEFESAGIFFLECEKFPQAAKAYRKQGNLAGAAEAYGKGGKMKESAECFLEYFETPQGTKEAQLKAAEACYTLLQDEAFQSKVGDDGRKKLLLTLGGIFEGDERLILAAGLYQHGGNLIRAGEMYLASGKLQEAAQCMKAGGNLKEANRIGGRYYEQIGRHKEAALAYAGAEEFKLAGDCFTKAKDPGQAAPYYVKAKAYAEAGLSFAHSGKYQDAVTMLQQVDESSSEFAVSRALLGRCFYEIRDFAHCVATLDNHLTGQRVDKATIEYFYMLALALEQVGKLEECRDYIYKIGAVDKGFRDVEQRLSSVESRISVMDSQVGKASGTQSADAALSQEMQLVENTLGSRYEFEQELGRGGMGVVFLARDKQLDRRVALKFLGALADSSDSFRKRFVREARTAAKISHPNIVSIYDISASEGKAYIAMEYVEGQNLHKFIRGKGHVEPRIAINIIGQACMALGAIHEAGIVHRDVKPENILIGKGSLVKLMDFGLAKADDNRLTAANVVMGTPCYMSPEQATGKDVDGRTDIYAIGLVLHEMLTGKTVFNEGEILERQVNEMPPPPSESAEGISAELDAIVMKCIAKNPDDRYQLANDLVADLRKLAPA